MPDAESSDYYDAFLTKEADGGPRVPIAGERIVIVLGKDERTGLPLEVSIHLRKSQGNRLVVSAIREPFTGWGPGTHYPGLLVEDVPARNLRAISVSFETIPEGDGDEHV